MQPCFCRPPHTTLRYVVLAATVAAFVGGSMLLVNLLDPYSNFGRLAVSLARPVVVVVNNSAAYALEQADNYSLAPYALKGGRTPMLVFTIAFALIVFGQALTRGRLYCNTICPVGTLLGLFSRAAAVKIRIGQKECNGCGRCARACKSDSINVASRTVDTSRCVDCFNCLTACPSGAGTFGLRIADEPRGHHGRIDKGRRRLLAAAGLSLAFVPRTSRGMAPIEVTVPNKIPIPSPPHSILPPGALGLERFVHTCTACHACVAQCPSQVLQPTLDGYGWNGPFMPHLDPVAGFCNLNCNRCGAVCPTGAITAFTLAEKKTIQVGVAKFVRDNCIVVLQNTACGACSEHCPTKAVYMVSEGEHAVPRMNPEKCLGCGACEHVCPAKPHKAIYVEPHAIHLTAKAPAATGVGSASTQGGIEAFPF